MFLDAEHELEGEYAKKAIDSYRPYGQLTGLSRSHAMVFRAWGVLPLSVLCLSLAAPIFAQPFPSRVRQALQTQLQATPANIKKIESGSTVAYLIDTGNPEDVLIVGATRIRATPEFFVEQCRNISEFEASPAVSGSGVLRTPPKLADLAGLTFTKQEVDDLRACKPGDCDFKAGDAGLAKLRAQVKWADKDCVNQANQAIRQLWLDGLTRYQKEANKALAKYHDKSQVFREEDGLTELMNKTLVLKQSTPALAAYLSAYPSGTTPWHGGVLLLAGGRLRTQTGSPHDTRFAWHAQGRVWRRLPHRLEDAFHQSLFPFRSRTPVPHSGRGRRRRQCALPLLHPALLWGRAHWHQGEPYLPHYPQQVQEFDGDLPCGRPQEGRGTPQIERSTAG
jgi:hypothetical protein